MKGFFFALFLLLSLPNLIVGLALLVLCHTFATLHPLEIVTNFLFQITWSVPLAAGLFLLLVVIGIISITRPYASVFALVLNAVALGLALFRLGSCRADRIWMAGLPGLPPTWISLNPKLN